LEAVSPLIRDGWIVNPCHGSHIRRPGFGTLATGSSLLQRRLRPTPEDSPMPRQFDPDEFAAAMRQVKHPKAPADTNTLPAEPLAVEEWQHSEEFKVRVIAARAKLKLMRVRSEALQDSLQEFRFRQSRMRA